MRDRSAPGMCVLFTAALLLTLVGGRQPAGADTAVGVPRLSPRNTEAPFCYRPGETRRWPIFRGEGSGRPEVVFTAREGDTVRGRGPLVRVSGVRVRLGDKGRLEISAPASGSNPAFDLDVEQKLPGGEVVKQTLQVRAAPPPRPLSYYADFGDELIRLFMDGSGQYRPIEEDAFDQYFRRLQAQGITRLIVWLSPFPFAADRRAYDPKDWERYERRARAILEDSELSRVLAGRSGFTSWGWLRQLMATHFLPEFGPMLGRSAENHGIRLSVSFRPFETAVSKYYEVPTFGPEGEWDGWFFPLASPAVTEHTEEVSFAHYREVLRKMGRAEYAEIGELRFSGMENAPEFMKNWEEGRSRLRILASPYPPQQSDSFVLQRQNGGDYRLVRWKDVEARADARRLELTGYQLRLAPDKSLRVTGLRVPAHFRYLLITAEGPEAASPAPDAETPVSVWSRAGTPLGRLNTYWALDESTPEGKKTRVAGIPANGEYYSQFYATEASGDQHRGKGRVPLAGRTLVVDRGDLWSPEMVDFRRPAARAYVVRELRYLLSLPGFDEIFLNTRSHTQLAASTADGAEGLRPIARYRAERKPYYHLGLDRAYAPLSLAEDKRLKQLARSPDTVSRITTWQPGEWEEPCQTASSPFAWRYARNRAVAEGMRSLVRDLERAFPRTRLRVVIPEGEAAVRTVEQELEQMERPGGGKFGKTYYRHLWNSVNHIPAIGEGMAMVDLSGLRAEPVFLGIRYLPDPQPLRLFLREQLRDLADNRGSRFRGPRSYFYEGHETLTYAGDGKVTTPERATAKRGREERICYLLSHPAEIKEIILYEAADWAYFMPLDDPDFCGHGYLDRRSEVLKAGGWDVSP